MYYQKNGMFYYKFNEIEKSYVEVFTNGTQQGRIVRFMESSLYDKALERVQANQFNSCTAEEFNQFVNQVKQTF